MPPIPSPAVGISVPEVSNKGVFFATSFNFCLLTISPIFSFNLTPKYNPDEIKMKNMPAKIDVDSIEFKNKLLCECTPEK